MGERGKRCSVGVILEEWKRGVEAVESLMISLMANPGCLV